MGGAFNCALVCGRSRIDKRLEPKAKMMRLWV